MEFKRGKEVFDKIDYLLIRLLLLALLLIAAYKLIEREAVGARLSNLRCRGLCQQAQRL